MIIFKFLIFNCKKTENLTNCCPVCDDAQFRRNLIFKAEIRDSMILWNGGSCILDCTVKHPKHVIFFISELYWQYIYVENTTCVMSVKESVS
jgi:hypothetical protein